ncbi:molybdate ABC transporter substrate-binding protein [Kamptonema sp. UHCC 0994]|uniref:molybdate ABC transporter substrate-binding protein n=1 Tax=Kamptonema sp. UHCC 0994 TaxID=3031329 RepID=UPI0023BA0013|nr:molybdate ABC transporter substrate-binding protein [Kamptonema sp. UHCC 0994]MDF0553654.1 molybdate ABC transporter substrate-binding protein [Kamptonema sp. UHCC 0994]
MTKTSRFSILFSCVVAFCFWLGSCTNQLPAKAVSINFASAPFYRDVLIELERQYRQEKFNVTINYTFSGSTALKERIEQGESFDICLITSKALDEFQKQGLLLSETIKDLVSTQMVLIVPVDSPLAIADFKDLTSDRIKTIAMGTERLGIGQYTKEILTNLGIFKQVQSKAVWANVEIREISKAVESNQADIGITYLPEAKSSNKLKIAAIAPTSSLKPIIAKLAVLKNSQHPVEAKALIEFLTSAKAMLIFEKYGFTTISPS